MKKILGLDLGSSSIGWAFVQADNADNVKNIIRTGVRLVPLSPDEKGEFESGNTITKNHDRTLKRQQRRGYDRYQGRRSNLKEELNKLGMLPDEQLLKHLPALQLFALRDKGLSEKLELQEIGRVLCHLNQKRGYKSLRAGADVEDGKKVTEYEQEINDRYHYIQQQGITIGQYFYQLLQQQQFARLKQLVFPRHAYIEEYNRLMKAQQQYYPNVLTDTVIERLRDTIIYYQRPLKSQKGLVSICEFAGVKHTDPKTGKITLHGPRVAPRSSPLFEVCKIWESINAITLQSRNKQVRALSNEEKAEIFARLNEVDRLSEAELFKLLKIKKGEYYTDALTRKKGIQGNLTYVLINNAISHNPAYLKWLQFNLKQQQVVNKQTAEVVETIDPSFEQEPLYRLWHLLYSIKEKDELENVLAGLGFDDATIAKLVRIDFTKRGFGNKSARAMRKILPHLSKGIVYSAAMIAAGYNHSGSRTKQEAAAVGTLEKLLPLPKNSLRQPVVEKILNQLINVVNAIIADPAMGKPDEIRIELARELKQSREERNKTYSNNNKRDRENKDIIKRLEEHGIRGTRKNIEKYRLWQEFQELSAYGPFAPEKKINFTQVFNGSCDIDHIVPQSRLFDDSFANKVLCTRKQNEDKGNQTAYDYMSSLGEDVFEAYLNKVDELYKNDRISRTKRDRLLMSANEIPEDFINRQLNETRYIVKKAKEILAPLLVEKEHSILCTNGSVTAFLRHQWGWDDVLVNINYEKYPEERKSVITEQTGRKRKVISDWSKREDHRHHAIDALTIACTNRSIIKRLNDLNKFTTEGLNSDEGLNTYAQKLKPFTTRQVEEQVSGMLISLKPGKKVASRSRNKVTGQTTLAPRGALSEDTVYGIIEHKGEKHYVVKYKLDLTFKLKDLEFVVDKGVRRALENRLQQFNNDPKQAFKDLEKNPVYLDTARTIPIKTIRMFTNLTVVEPVKFNAEGKPIGFVKPGNNHHIAIYENEKGKRIEKVVTFWEAVARRNQGLPVIDNNPIDGTRFITSMQQNEMFVFNLTHEQLQDAVDKKDYDLISRNLYRVRKLTAGNYWFNHHLETQPRESLEDKKAGRCIQASPSSFKGIKVRVNHLGIITKIGE